MKIIDNNHLLRGHQTNLLITSVKLPFVLGEYSSLYDILTSLNVDVIVEPGIVERLVPAALNEAEEYWREKDADKATEIRKEKEIWSQMPLRGEYDPETNVIKLYPDEMKQEYEGIRVDELLITTLAHETMHAYFNRSNHKDFPYVIHIEEPLAEFGMLLYLYETHSMYFHWADRDVRGKKTCYKYGAQLMRQHLCEGGDYHSSIQQYLEEYKMDLHKFAMPIVNAKGDITLPVSNEFYPPYFKSYPQFFYDKATGILGLDNDWNRYSMLLQNGINCMIGDAKLSHVFLGDNFSLDECWKLNEFLEEYDVIVSPLNKMFYAVNGVPFRKDTNKPFLEELGDGLYKLCRDGKWGLIDDKANTVVPFLFDNILKNSDGTYTVKQNGSKIIFHKSGKAS